MADPLSIAAGSVSFISLVIQILDKAKQIYDFWRDLDGMPNRFQPLLTDMAVVKTVLREIVDTAQQESYPEAECLIQRCNSQIELLLGEVRDFRRQPPRRRASRVRLTFKLVYKEQKIEEMRHSVLEVLRYLSLALQVIHSRGVSKIAKFAPEIVAIREANRSIIEISSSSLDSISKIAADCLTMKKLLGPDEGFSEMALSSLEGCVKKAVASAVAEIQPKESEMASDLTRDTEEENRHAEKLPRWMGEKRSHKLSGCRKNPSSASCPCEDSTRYSYHGGYQLNLFFGTLALYRSSSGIQGPVHPLSACHRQITLGLLFVPSKMFRTGISARLFMEWGLRGYTISQRVTTRLIVPFDDEVIRLVKSADVDGVKAALMARHLSVNMSCPDGKTLVHYAAAGGDARMVTFLLQHGADCSTVDIHGRSTGYYMIGTSCFSYTKEDQRPDTTAMLVKTNRIEAYVPGRGPGSSVIHDIVHDAQSGIIPQISTKDFSTTWKNLDSDVEVDVMNNVGQTPLSVLCGQPRGDSRLVNLFLSSGADPNARPGCLPKYTGLTCLHQAIYSLQPLKIPGLSTFVDHASTFARFNPEFVSWPRSAKFHSSQTRELQRQKIRALVDHGVDLFAVSTEFGTPTDVARLSDNFFLWCSVLADSGIDVPKFLARDKTVLRNFRLGCWYRKKQQSQAIRRDMGKKWRTLRSAIEETPDPDHRDQVSDLFTTPMQNIVGSLCDAVELFNHACSRLLDWYDLGKPCRSLKVDFVALAELLQFGPFSMTEKGEVLPEVFEDKEWNHSKARQDLGDRLAQALRTHGTGKFEEYVVMKLRKGAGVWSGTVEHTTMEWGVDGCLFEGLFQQIAETALSLHWPVAEEQAVQGMSPAGSMPGSWPSDS